MQPQLEDDLEAIYRENRGQQAGDEERRRINLEAGIINP
jgi:hypothetical protein